MHAPPPLPGRECGECRVCCIELEIDDPELKKPDEVACPHLSTAAGCLIHARRPGTCRDWFCGWRVMRLPDDMRPDRSNLLLILEMGTQPGYQRGGLKIVPLNRDFDAVTRPELVDLAGRSVVADVPIYLSFGAGRHCKRVLANDVLKPAAQAGDRAAFVQGLRSLLDQLVDEADSAARGG